MSRKTNRVLGLLAIAGLMMSAEAFAGGFEKADFWSGHYAGISGAAESIVTGPESLFFNPAALAGSEGLQIAGNISPTIVQFSGPFNATLGTVSSKSAVPVPGSLFVSTGITPQWGVGIGFDVVSANRADYDNVTLGIPGISFTPNIKGDFTATELSVGTGYEIIPGLKIGASYRVTFISAELAAAGSPILLGGPNIALVYFDINNISQTIWDGFRLGLQWAPKDSPFGLGITYRYRVNFNASGTATVVNASSTGVAGAPTGTSSAGGSPSVSGTLPQRLDVATHYHFSPEFTAFLAYDFTNFSADPFLAITGLTVAGSATNSTLPLAWRNQHTIRVAGEYTGIEGWPIRLGFAADSEVTPKSQALPIILSPGPGFNVSGGTGHKVTSNLTLDGAVEYGWIAGTVAAADNPVGTTQTGDYSAHAIAFHLGATYAF